MHHPLRNTSPLALGAALAGAIGFFVVFSTATGDAATSCAWCESNRFDEAVRASLVADDARFYGRTSHAFSLLFAPALAIAAAVAPAAGARRARHAFENFAILVTGFVLTTGIADGVKKLTDRERPGFHHGRGALLEAAHAPLERHLSFFSGDTAWAFMFVTAGVAIARLRGYRTPRWLVPAAAVVAFVGGALRIVADMHWATDVFAGALVGAAVGAGLPSLAHRRVEPQTAPS